MKKILLFIVTLCWAMNMHAVSEMYGVLSSNKQVLTLYYDESRASRKGVTDWSVYNNEKDKSGIVKKVVIDASFQHAKPLTTSHWFSSFSYLEEIEGLQYLNTQEVTDMSNMFSSTRLKRLDLSTFNTKNVTNMSGIFSLCTRLTHVNLTGWSTRWVTDMSAMFNSCQALKYVDVSGFNTANVTDMTGMFYDTGLETLDLTNFDVSKVTKMLLMFTNSDNLQRIYAKDWTEGKDATMSMMMFLGCYSLSGDHGTVYDNSNIDISYARPDDGSTHGYFSAAAKLFATKDNKEGTSITFYYHNFGYFTNFKPEEIENAKTVRFDESVRFARETSTAHLLDGFTNLETIEHLEYLNTENVTDMSYMFANCPKLKSVDVSSLTTDNVTTMSHMFAGCSALESLDVCGFELGSATDVSSMFEGDSRLKTIYCNCSWAMYDGLTSSANMFLGCTSLPNYDASYVNRLYAHPKKGGYFTGMDELYCDFGADGTQCNLRYDQLRGDLKGVAHWDKYLYPDVNSVTIDKSVQNARPTSMRGWFSSFKGMRSIKGLNYLNTSEVTDMSYLFAYCWLLMNVDVSEFDMNKVTNVSHMFDGCTYLRAIYSKADWSQLSGIKQSEYMFLGCRDLVGGSFTKYNRDNVDKAYAHLDGGKDNPGYFTAPVELYGALGKDKKTVTLYYDSYCVKNEGQVNWMGSFGKANIEKIVIDPSVSGIAWKDMSYMFFELKNLKAIEGLQYLNTSICTDMSFMFAGCSSLTRLDISTFNIKSLTNAVGLFANCSQLERIYCDEDWSASEKLTESEYMFQGCTSLKGSDGTTLDANHLDKEYARIGSGSNPGYFHISPTIYGATSEEGKVFTLYCDDQLTARSGMTDWIPVDWRDVEKIVIDVSMKKARPTSTKQWFRNFGYARRIEGIENLNTSEVTDMSYMFSHCHALECLDLTGFQMGKVKDFSYMFEECNNLERIFCDQDWHIVGEWPFYGCKKLEGNVSGAKCKGNATDTSNGYAKVGDAETPGYFSLYEYEPMEIYGLLSEDEKTLTIQYDNRRRINDGKLDWSIYCSARGFEVEEIVLDPSMSDAKPTSMEAWFNYFQHVTTITGLNGLNTSEVTDMSSLFSNCKGLTSLDLTNFNTANVTDMELMFDDCTGLTELELPSFITSNVTTMKCMFCGCTGLKKLNLNSFLTTNVTNMMMMFAGCSELTTIICTSDWYNSSCWSDWMFWGCEKLVGEMGTTYDEEKIDGTYAHVDGEGGLPGYFTTPNPPTYYTVRFEDYDGTLLQEGFVAEGKDAIPPIHPMREGYTFTGWDKDLSAVTENLEIHAVYEINHYTVTIIAENGTVTVAPEETNLTSVEYGTKLTLTAVPDEGYMFENWTNYDGTELTVNYNVTVTATFKIKTFFVTFLDKDGNQIGETQIVNWNEAAEAPEAPQVEGYHFSGWSEDITHVQDYLNVEAQYEINTFTVTFVGFDDVEIDKKTVNWNEAAEAPEAPEVEGYKFTGWDKEFNHVTEDLTVKATYELAVYQVTLVAENGKITVEEEVNLSNLPYGTKLHLTATPDYGYTFDHWENYNPETGLTVSEDITVTAYFKPQTFTLTVTAEPAEGGTFKLGGVDENRQAAYMSDYTIEAIPAEGYEFVEWRDGNEVLDNKTTKMSGVLYGNVTIVGVFKPTIVYHTVTFLDWDATELLQEKVEEGHDAQGPETDPEREGYTFIGWSKPITNITSNLTVIAQYEKKDATGVDEVPSDQVPSTKVLRDGQLLIVMPDGKTYNAQGQRVR